MTKNLLPIDISLPRAKNLDMEEKIEFLKGIVEALKNASSLDKKESFLSQLLLVKRYLSESPAVQIFLLRASLLQKVIVQSIIVIGQEDLLSTIPAEEEVLFKIIEQLLPIEQFYAEQGGGYRLSFINASLS